MAESMMSPECARVETEIVVAYRAHIGLFRKFATMVNGWLTNYEQKMAPMLMRCLEDVGNEDTEANYQLVASLTKHAERFAKLVHEALAEYEEAYKIALAIFKKFIK